MHIPLDILWYLFNYYLFSRCGNLFYCQILLELL